MYPPAEGHLADAGGPLIRPELPPAFFRSGRSANLSMADGTSVKAGREVGLVTLRDVMTVLRR
jgi:hypothetical protein